MYRPEILRLQQVILGSIDTLLILRARYHVAKWTGWHHVFQRTDDRFGKFAGKFSGPLQNAGVSQISRCKFNHAKYLGYFCNPWTKFSQWIFNGNAIGVSMFLCLQEFCRNSLVILRLQVYLHLDIYIRKLSTFCNRYVKYLNFTWEKENKLTFNLPS